MFLNRFKSPLILPEESGYFRRVADYIHLNPVRAKMLTKKSPKLTDCVWSSFPSLGPTRKRPAWQECSRTNIFLAVKACEFPRAEKEVKAYRRKLESLRVNK